MLAFDTHQYVKQLQSAGFTEEQAEIQANALKTIVENELATKQDIAVVQRDIKALEAATKQDIKALEVEIKRDIKELELRLRHALTLRLGGMLVVGIGVIATLIKLL